MNGKILIEACCWSCKNFDRSRGATLSKWRIFSLSDEHYFVVIPLNFEGWTWILNTFKVTSSDCNVKSSDSVRLHATQEKPIFHSKAYDEPLHNKFVIVNSTNLITFVARLQHHYEFILWDISIWIFKSRALIGSRWVQTDKILIYAKIYWTLK